MVWGFRRAQGDCNFPSVPMASDKIIVFQAGAYNSKTRVAASG